MLRTGNKIKEIRKAQGLSQMQLAELANISRVFMSDIENNKKEPSITTMFKIASALKVSIDAVCNLQAKTKKSSPYNPEEQRYINMLIDILRGSNAENIEAIKSNIVAFWKSRDMETPIPALKKTAG